MPNYRINSCRFEMVCFVLFVLSSHGFLSPRVATTATTTKSTILFSTASSPNVPTTTPSSVLESYTTTTVTLKQQGKQQIPYDWKNQWYALTFANYIPNPSQSAEAVPAAVFGHPLVLWRGQDNGLISCADDVCPHRAAALSEGRVRDGRLECQYHGWQFQGRNQEQVVSSEILDGKCVKIPQLEPGVAIPKRACLSMRPVRVVEGIVWVWMGDDKKEPSFDPPRSQDGLDDETGKKKGFLGTDFQIDLPYDHSYLVEVSLLSSAFSTVVLWSVTDSFVYLLFSNHSTLY
jgi:nitrite reductase/ring-hydroxylating ferredoxin subunit